MTVMSRAVVLAATLLGVQGARMKKQPSRHQSTKFVAGVPILNYELAYGGATSLAERKGKQQWIVVVQKGVADKDIDALCKMSKCVREGHPDKNGVSYFEIYADEAELEKVLSAGVGAVKFVEPDVEMHLIPDIQSDAQATSWGLDRVGTDTRPNSGAGAHVYVLDTGIRTSHNDYGGRAIATLDLSSNSLVECSGNSGCASDAQGHGSHCAGTAAGGSYGIARDATIHAVKVLSDSGSGQFSWSFDALDWMATKGERPAIASMSLGGQGVLASMETAVDAAVDAGITVVVAGGNSNRDACGFSPAFVGSAITVGSTTISNARSSFSNYGACTDIWAPGSDITSVGIRSDTASQTYSGTSMACPHVSGAAAVILSASPGLKPSGVMAALAANAEQGAISGLKSGDTNIFLWVGAGDDPEPAPTPVPAPDPSRRRFWYYR
jgi:subtilisin family serine protease